MRPWMLCLLTACASSLLLPAGGDEEQPKAKSAPSILASSPVAKNGEPLLLPVTLCSKTYRFLVDTGCTGIVYDETLPLGKATGSVDVLASCGITQARSY